MPIDQTTWRELEQIARRLGSNAKLVGDPPADDEALWKVCQRECRPVRGMPLDAELRRAVRRAYNDGYLPFLVSLTQTVRSLRRLGYFAEVTRTDSGAVLVAGRWPHTGRDEDPWPVSIGPGWRHGPEAFATTDTAIVAHRSGQLSHPVPPGTTAAQLAELLVAAVETDPDSCGGKVMPTAIAEVDFERSQIAAGVGALTLIHDGEHGAEAFQQLLAALVDDRLAAGHALQQRGVEVTVFSTDRATGMTRTHGLLTHHRAGSLGFSCGHRIPVAEVVSIHVHLLPGACPVTPAVTRLP